MQMKEHAFPKSASPDKRPSSDHVISVPEAAAIAGLSTDTLKRRAKAGDLKILKLSTRRLGVRLSELNRWLDTCVVQ